MKTNDFDYHLPSERIAQAPVRPRTRARMLYFERQTKITRDYRVSDLPGLLQAGDLLVFNSTKVRQARLFGERFIEGKLIPTELLILKALNSNGLFSALIGGKKIRLGQNILLNDQKNSLTVVAHDQTGPGFSLQAEGLNSQQFFDLCEEIGRLPLPPYIHNSALLGFEQELYQPITAKKLGSVAAPTASLHFDQQLIDELISHGLAIGELTLHVGLGTFLPVRAESIEEHQMHQEEVEVSSDLLAKIKQTKSNGGKIIAIGTTVVRALETAASNNLTPFFGPTELFITPGYQFKVVNGLLTNFHMPKSTLMMMVSALIGRENLLELYQRALDSDYRFLSFGDCMLLL